MAAALITECLHSDHDGGRRILEIVIIAVMEIGNHIITQFPDTLVQDNVGVCRLCKDRIAQGTNLIKFAQ